MGTDKQKPTSKGQAWFCTTGLPSDIVIEVDEMCFHLHKFPLMSKSRKLHQLIKEQETSNPAVSTETEHKDEEQDENEDQIELHINLSDFPGSSESFEIAAKFCYGVKIEVSSTNVVSLRCAAEYLEMTEDYSEDNLISKTERFFTQSVLRSIKESIKTLTSCESIMSLAESLNIPQRCIDSIAARASSADPSLFGWPMNEGSIEVRTSNQILWNGIDTGARKKSNRSINAESWFEDLAFLSLPLYNRVISAMKDRDLSSEMIESLLISYARKSVPGISRSTRKQTSNSIATEAEQRELLETLIMNMPLEKSSRSSTAARHLFGLLRTANILNVSEGSRTILEKKIAWKLEQASLDDLLIPSYSYLIETLYDVDCIERILKYFLENLRERSANEMDGGDVEEEEAIVGSPVMLVGKLIDGYLSEIASDANLKPQKFIDLAIALPDQARSFDDGLYRAVDVYLKAHPTVTEEEREKISGVMDCQKLTLEACTHAAQNERLPLRAVVQVLFFEQLQLRHAIAGSLLAATSDHQDSPLPACVLQLEHHQENVDHHLHNNTWKAAIRENQVLRLDMDSMRSRVHELERECSTMKKVIHKFDVAVGSSSSGGWRNTISKKFGCKFKTQVCDSHERAVVENRKGSSHQRQKSL
ncbi:BTB/POZ domain-containing protein family [Thalictrum thalictroides]|uniref:BTB/POZ domain-containing protein family n=1 Tax=Thalictrum thalictroides TaxID=46969 RepID=A0A7J6W3Z0_THATH|nr:BTB/POZ domain-containing protein family [Thalictrum thalictroides]